MHCSLCKFSAATFLDLCSEIINSHPLSCPLSWRSRTKRSRGSFSSTAAHYSPQQQILVAEQFCPFYLVVCSWQEKTLSFPTVKYTRETRNWLPASCQQTSNNERMFCALALTQPSKMCLFCVFFERMVFAALLKKTFKKHNFPFTDQWKLGLCFRHFFLFSFSFFRDLCQNCWQCVCSAAVRQSS